MSGGNLAPRCSCVFSFTAHSSTCPFPAQAPPKHMVVAKRGHQVLSRSAERSLVAFLSQADSMSSRKLSPDQVALGRELRQARAKEAVAGKKGAAPKAAAAHAK
mmetsp:Transcript_21831/g.59811  ORF Transcript_21831/g.59811 Transcript_21831/m.59811 type:complete len:104 (-) Transcript_21831:36-347(-)